MAPEIFAGEPATTRSDVYSLGALLFELCVGKPPFVESDIAQLSSVVQSQDAPSLDSLIPDGIVSAGLSRIVTRCLRRNPLERYPDGNELWQALTQLSSGISSSTELPSESQRTEKKPLAAGSASQRRWLWGLAILSLTGLWLGRSYVTPSLPMAATTHDAGLGGQTLTVDASPDLRMPDLREPAALPDLRESPTDLLRPQPLPRPKAKPQTQGASPSPKPAVADPVLPVRPVPVEKPIVAPVPISKPDSSESVEIPIER
jgi:serine/threonine protein kinase